MSENSRWTYTKGTRPEGVIIYDGGQKCHSHHDSDPAHGQHNSWDLTRIHLFGKLDEGADPATPVMERPSSRAMIALALEQPEVRAAQAGTDFEVLPPLMEPVVVEVNKSEEVKPTGLAKKVSDVIRNPTIARWLIKDVLERGVIAVMAGTRGSYKSFLALGWAMECAAKGHDVYFISAEGGDFDRRAKAWLIDNDMIDRVENIPLYVLERRIDLSTKEGVEKIRADCAHHRAFPALFVIDTYSKSSGSLDENDNSKIKAWVGLLDNGLKRAYDATVLLIAHTGHTEQGRPRGASALGADTDAEYIVARNALDNSVSVTRQRFKSSPELPPLNYQPEIVDLGYSDHEGAMVTSLVLLPADPPANGAQRVVLKKHPGRLLAIAREMLADKDEIVIADLLDVFVERTPHDVKTRDRRRRTGAEALNVLTESRFLVLRSASTVALTHATEAATVDFTKEQE